MPPDVAVDPRLQNLIMVAGYGDHRPIVIGSPVGGDSALLISTKGVAAEASKFRRTALEVAEYIRMPSERGHKLSAAATPLVTKLREAATTYRDETSRIHKLAATATAVPAWSERTGMHVLLADMEIARRVYSADQPTRTRILAEAQREPAKHRRVVEALLRADLEITGLDAETWHGIRMSALKAFEPQLYEAIETEQAQAQLARRALHVAATLVRGEAPAAWTEATTASPDLIDFTKE